MFPLKSLKNQKPSFSGANSLIEARWCHVKANLGHPVNLYPFKPTKNRGNIVIIDEQWHLKFWRNHNLKYHEKEVGKLLGNSLQSRTKQHNLCCGVNQSKGLKIWTENWQQNLFKRKRMPCYSSHPESTLTLASNYRWWSCVLLEKLRIWKTRSEKNIFTVKYYISSTKEMKYLWI